MWGRKHEYCAACAFGAVTDAGTSEPHREGGGAGKEHTLKCARLLGTGNEGDWGFRALTAWSSHPSMASSDRVLKIHLPAANIRRTAG
jgi:hypothetical protein